MTLLREKDKLLLFLFWIVIMKVLDVLVAVVSCHQHVHVKSIWNKTKYCSKLLCIQP